MSNREIASLILLAVFVIFALSIRGVRSSIPALLKTFFSPKLFIPLVAYAAIIAGTVWIASIVGAWEPALLSSTIFWFVLSGLGLYFSVNKAAKDEDFFKSSILDTMRFAALFEFFINIQSLSLVAELILQAVLILLGLLSVVSKTKNEFEPARKVADGLLSIIVLGLVVFTVISIAGNVEDQDILLLVKSLLLPVWLTIVSVPYIFLIALYAGYETLLTRLFFLNEQQRPRARALAGVMLGLRTRLADIDQFGNPEAHYAVRATSIAEARHQVAEFKHRRQLEFEQRVAARERLASFADVDGIDAEGCRLDRREFAETKKALGWLATCHMGWYRRADRYKPDLLTTLGDFESHGLPGNHGINMHVSQDGQCWYAYRRTVSGWYFGIGATKEPPDTWHYDGDQPPNGYPTSGENWTGVLEPTRTEWRDEEPA